MKNKIAIFSSIVLMTGSGVMGQQAAPPSAAPPAGGPPVSAAPPSAPARPSNPVNPAQPPQPGVIPGVQQVPPPAGAASNQVPFGATTNQFGNTFGATNQFTFTNQLGLGATNGAFGSNLFAFTNSVLLTNNFLLTNGFGTNSGLIAQDQALTPADRPLLIQVRQAVQVRGLAGAFAPAVHFLVQQSVVTMVGFVSTPAQSQQIQTVVQTVPGVTRVVNNLAIRALPDMAFTAGDQALVSQIRTTLQPQLTTLSGAVPIRFIARDGVVTIVGSVPSADQRAQVEAALAGIPGIVRVNDQLQVASQQGRLGTNFGTPTNLLPTGLTNVPTSIFSTTNTNSTLTPNQP